MNSKIHKLLSTHSAHISENTIKEICEKISRGELGVMTAGSANEIISRVRSGEMTGINPLAMDDHDELALIQPIVVLHVEHHWESKFISRLVEMLRIRQKPCGKHVKQVCHNQNGIGNKFLSLNESPIEAALRCFREKLHIKDLEPEIKYNGQVSITCTLHPNYGKIPMVLVRHIVHCLIPKDKFNPAGREVKRTKPNGEKVTTVFSWLPANAICN